MNLHGIARGLISVVNPETAALVRVSTGYTQDRVGRQIPAYAQDAVVSAQVQDLSQRDILHLDSLNIQGSQKVMYLAGNLSGLVRPLGKGGDLIILDDGSVWLVNAVMEAWPDWCKVAVTLQTQREATGQLDFSNPGNSGYKPLI